MSIWRRAEWIDAVPEEFRVSLGEGDTPLVRSRAIGPAAGFANLYFKLDMVNPTGSYKDRFAAAAISHMRAAGKTRCLATTSGNTGAALAAYCAAAGIRCEIAIVETAPVDKLKQMLAYGATLCRIRGFGIDPQVTAPVLDLLQERGREPDCMLQISAFQFSPAGMSGVQTVSYELAEQIGDRLDHVFCPAGGGGLALAAARGFERMRIAGKLQRPVRVEIVQPTGNDTIATDLREGRDRGHDVQCTTKISGLQVPNVIDGHLALAECRDSGGSGHAVADEEVWRMQARLAKEEGIFSEPAGAVAVTGAIQALRDKRIEPDATVVCLVTGFGFKDAPSVNRMATGAECPLLDFAEFRKRMVFDS
jgi:threonine synthase